MAESVEVSVIVPLYNAEGYIKSCVDSILNQDLKDIEVIIIDDCSTDKSLELCSELYGKNSRVKIIRQEKNSGPGAARNLGIKQSVGKYIAFSDSDDQMISSNLSSMFETAEKYNADIVHATGFLVSKVNNQPDLLSLGADNFIRSSFDKNPAQEITVLEGNLDDRLQKWAEHYYHCSLWNKLYRRDLIINKNITFGDTPMGEDLLFCFDCLFHAERYVIMPFFGYIYRLLQESLSRARSPIDILIKTLRSQIGILRKIQRDMQEIPFFAENESNYDRVLDALNSQFERFHIIPCYKQISQEELKHNENLSEFFKESFGQDAPFVERLFKTANDLQPDMPDLWKDMSSPEFWAKFEGKNFQ